MEWHVRVVEELFSAARCEFKRLDNFYFHNCLYERVWKQNRRRHEDTTATWEVLHTYAHDYKVIIVGDASMSPYEVTTPGGSVEHFNDEPGAVWLNRLTRTYPACVWLNPVPREQWGLHLFDWPDTRALNRPHVSAHARGSRPRRARTRTVRGRAAARVKAAVSQSGSSRRCELRG